MSPSDKSTKGPSDKSIKGNIIINKLSKQQQQQQQSILKDVPHHINHNNHNYCFIEAHTKDLQEQQAANNTIIQLNKERMAIVNRFNQIISETECKDNICNEKMICNEKNICNEINNMEVKSEYLEKELTILPTTRRIVQEKQKNQSVENPDQRRIVQETQSRGSKKNVESTPTDTIEKSSKINKNSESEMETHVYKVSTNPPCVLGIQLLRVPCM